MNLAVNQALELWGMQGASYHLIATRENQVFRVDINGSSYALRLHRAGYRTNEELRSELQWMDAVSRGGLHVPAPIASASGDFLHIVDGVQIDVLSWLNGAPMGATGQPLGTKDRTSLFLGIGREMARLHDVSDRWALPDDFDRCSWDRNGLLGDNPLWGRFWENPTLSAEDRELFEALRGKMATELTQLEDTLDYGLIHADLVRENILVDGDRLQLIDFDDSGFGFRLFDLATTLLKNLQEPDYPELKEALLAGYRSERPLDDSALDLFLLLRAATYVGWVIDKLSEEGSELRNQRFIDTTRKLALRYLG